MPVIKSGMGPIEIVFLIRWWSLVRRSSPVWIVPNEYKRIHTHTLPHEASPPSTRPQATIKGSGRDPGSGVAASQTKKGFGNGKGLNNAD